MELRSSYAEDTAEAAVLVAKHRINHTLEMAWTGREILLHVERKLNNELRAHLIPKEMPEPAGTT